MHLPNKSVTNKEKRGGLNLAFSNLFPSVCHHPTLPDDSSQTELVTASSVLFYNILYPQLLQYLISVQMVYISNTFSEFGLFVSQSSLYHQHPICLTHCTYSFFFFYQVFESCDVIFMQKLVISTHKGSILKYSYNQLKNLLVIGGILREPKRR